MAIVQIGYLGNAGPVFVDDATAGSKKIVLLGDLGANKLIAKQPAWADNLRNSTAGSQYVFTYSSADCALGPYTDNQIVGDIPAYKKPPTGTTFDYYWNVQSDWVAVGAPPSTGGGSTGGGSGSGSTGSGSTGTGTGTTTTTTTTDTTFSAPTISEQISTFLSNYWWLVLGLLLLLLWKPLIAPALGLSKKKRR